MPPTISRRLVGVDKLQTAFNKFATVLPTLTNVDTRAALTAAVAKSPGYLGGNSYSVPNGDVGPHGTPRTGNLGRSTMVWQEGGSVRITVSAYSPKGFEYGPLVLGYADGSGQGYTASNGQFVSNSHWPTLRSVVDEQIALLTQPGAGLDADLSKAAKDAGL